MKLKDLEKIKLLETALMLGIPSAFLFSMNETPLSWVNGDVSSEIENLKLVVNLSSIPRLIDCMINFKIEPHTEDYKKIKDLYDKIILNFVDFLKKQDITDPLEIFVVYQYLYRNGYLSYNQTFNYDVNMKDLSKLSGADVVRGTGVCRSISSFLTDVYKKFGYNSCNLLVNANRGVLDSIERQGNYPKWKITNKTQKFSKIVTKFTSVLPVSNHLITFIEKDGKCLIFDPTNDGFLIKRNNNELVLPNNEKESMKLNYLLNSIQRILGAVANLKGNKELKEELNLPTIDYEEYKRIYIETLNYCKNNIQMFQEFYENNKSLYEDLFMQIEEQSSMLCRLVPELKLFNFNRFRINNKFNRVGK